MHHYTTRNAALGSILSLGQLRISPLAWTNDPRESQRWFYNLSDVPETNLDFDAINLMLKQVDDRIRGTTKLVCMTRSDPEKMARDGADHKFARGWSHSRMWDQYAQGHSGLCLIFDRNKLSGQVRKSLDAGMLWEQPVYYSDTPHGDVSAQELDYPEIERVGVETFVEEHIKRHWETLFFMKTRDWESECEYRWVYRDSSPAPVFVSIEESLAGIVVGASFPEVDRPLLKHYSDRFGITNSVARCHWHNGAPLVMPMFPRT